jgi:hypothetical protein
MDGLWFGTPQKLCISPQKRQNGFAWAGFFGLHMEKGRRETPALRRGAYAVA